MEHPVLRVLMLACFAGLAFLTVVWAFCAALNDILQVGLCDWVLTVVASARESVVSFLRQW